MRVCTLDLSRVPFTSLLLADIRISRPLRVVCRQTYVHLVCTRWSRRRRQWTVMGTYIWPLSSPVDLTKMRDRTLGSSVCQSRVAGCRRRESETAAEQTT